MNSGYYVSLIATTIFSCLIAAESTLKYSDCGSIEGKILNVSLVPPCADVCILPSGQNVTFKIGFQSHEVCDQVKVLIHGIIGGVPFPFPFDHPNACVDSGLKCPLQNGQDYLYTTVISVLPSYPKISLEVKFELEDGNQNDVVCVLIPAKIQ